MLEVGLIVMIWPSPPSLLEPEIVSKSHPFCCSHLIIVVIIILVVVVVVVVMNYRYWNEFGSDGTSSGHSRSVERLFI